MNKIEFEKYIYDYYSNCKKLNFFETGESLIKSFSIDNFNNFNNSYDIDIIFYNQLEKQYYDIKTINNCAIIRFFSNTANIKIINPEALIIENNNIYYSITELRKQKIKEIYDMD